MSTSHTSERRIRELLEELNNKIGVQLYQFLDGTLLVNQRLLVKILEGDVYLAGWRLDDVASGSSADFEFENPSGSGVYANIITIGLIGTGNGRVNMYPKNQYTVNASGTSVSPFNLNPASGKSAKCIFRYGGTYTPGTPAVRQVLPGGSRIRAVGGIITVDVNLRVPEGFSFLVEIVNQSASAEDFSARMMWWEESL